MSNTAELSLSGHWLRKRCVTASFGSTRQHCVCIRPSPTEYSHALNGLDLSTKAYTVYALLAKKLFAVC